MKLGRFLLSIVVIGLLVGLGSANGQECAGLFGAIVVGFAFCLFGDLLEFLGGFGRVLFWLCVTFGMFCAFAASYQDLFPQPQDIHSIQDLLMGGGDFYSFNILERIFVFSNDRKRSTQTIFFKEINNRTKKNETLI